MKNSSIMVLGLSLCLAAMAGCEDEPVAGAKVVYSPEEGVVCDRAMGFCSDQEGISLGLSEAYLAGTAVHEAFLAQHAPSGYSTLETRNYRFSDGTYCDHAEKWCGDPATGTMHEEITKDLFGA